MLRRILSLILAVAVLASVSGCSFGKAKVATPKPEPTFPLTITDDTGRSITVPAVPQRIVSLAPSNTEILFALGLGAKVVGVDKYSNFPAEAATITRVGGFSNPSVETIASLKPDLILGTSMHTKVVGQLESLGIPVVLLAARDVEGVLTNFSLVGRITSSEEKADALASEIRSRIKKVQDKLGDLPEDRRPLVYYEVNAEPMITVGPQTFINHLLQLAGGRNIAADAASDYPEYSSEIILKKNPQVIIYPSFEGPESPALEKFKSRPGWTQIEAVKGNRIFSINADIISRPGPRIADAVEELARLLYPDRFSK